MLFELLLSVLVLFGNAFFVGAEFAVVAARRSSIELLALKGSWAAKITLKAMENVSLMLAGAQLGITLCSLIFGAVAKPLVAYSLAGVFAQFGWSEFWLDMTSYTIALILMVYLHVVIGEMVPKNISLAVSVKAAMVLVPPLYFIVKLSGPIIVSLNAIANTFIRMLGIKPRDEVRSAFSNDEVAGFVKESHREGLLSRQEEQIVSGALDLEERTIEHIVLPIARITLTSLEPTPEEIEQLCARTGFSRFPVPDGADGLRGYVHLKDILQVKPLLYQTPLKDKLIRPLGDATDKTSLRSALAMMQHTGSHIARVSDAQGKVVGVVLLEDVMEELVGPIRDDAQRQQQKTLATD